MPFRQIIPDEPLKIYVASSWRNEDRQQAAVKTLREAGYEVYDFRNPVEGENGFGWHEIEPDWRNWTPKQFVKILNHPIALHGYCKDMDALMQCDALVLVLPCGRSAHLEAGIAIGMGKPTFILLSSAGFEPELMYKAARICLSLEEIVENVKECCHYRTKTGFVVARSSHCIHTKGNKV